MDAASEIRNPPPKQSANIALSRFDLMLARNCPTHSSGKYLSSSDFGAGGSLKKFFIVVTFAPPEIQDAM